MKPFQGRSASLISATLSAVGSKVLSVISGLLSVPLLLGLLGTEGYGQWVVILTLFVWLTLADLGLGSGLTHALATAQGRGDQYEAQRIVSTSFWMLCILSLGLLLIGGGTWPFLNGMFCTTPSVHGRCELFQAASAGLALTILGLPLTVVLRIYYALQEGGRAGIWTSIAILITFGMTLWVVALNGNLLMLALAFCGSQLFVGIVNALWLFGKDRPQLRPSLRTCNWYMGRHLISLSLLFFVLQIEGMIFIHSDQLIIAATLTSTDNAIYHVAYRMFMYTTMLQTLLTPVLWPAYTEALAHGDAPWVRRTFWLTMLVSLMVTGSLTIPLVLFGEMISLWWTNSAIRLPQSLLVWMGLWCLIEAFFYPIGFLLNALGWLHWQALYGLLTAIANVAITLYLTPKWGVTGAIAGTVIAYFVFTLVPTIIETMLALQHLPQSNNLHEQH